MSTGERVYRAFDKTHVAEAGSGHRLNSAFFRSKKNPNSVYLASETTLEEVAKKHPPPQYGIASMLVSELEAYGLKIEPEPDPRPDDLAAHRVIRNNNRAIAAEVAFNARIERPLVGYQVVSGRDGSVGVS